MVNGKTIMVTGGSSGIGLACCAEVVSRGGFAVVVDNDRATGEEVASQFGSDGMFWPFDVTQDGQWATACEEVVRRKGRLNGLVNCASADSHDDNVEELSDAEWRRLMAINLDSVFLGCRHAIRTMRKLSCGGAIVNISSVFGLVGDGNALAYSTSKGGVRMLTKSVALYCAREKLNIRCNSVHPGFVDAGMLAARNDAPRAAESEGVQIVAMPPSSELPLGRIAAPSEIAAVVQFHLSAESDYITGAEYVVDGGFTAT